MGWWSRLKKAVKKAVKKFVQIIKAVVRTTFRFGLFVLFLGVNIWDLLFGFLNWPPKNLTLHIVILSDKNGPLVQEKDLIPSIEYARRVLKDRLNVKSRAYSRNFVETLKEPAPDYALNVKPCTLSGIFHEELGDSGEFYAKHIAGWNGAPISFRFPVTVFVIHDVTGGYVGCSPGLLGDYSLVVIDVIKENPASTMMHEIGHSCNIIDHYWTDINDLMYGDYRDSNNNIRGDRITWGKRNLIRASRHVTYW